MIVVEIWNPPHAREGNNGILRNTIERAVISGIESVPIIQKEDCDVLVLFPSCEGSSTNKTMLIRVSGVTIRSLWKRILKGGAARMMLADVLCEKLAPHVAGDKNIAVTIEKICSSTGVVGLGKKKAEQYIVIETTPLERLTTSITN